MTAKAAWLPQNQALALGIVLSVIGSLFLYDAFEHRGATRPFALKFLPGP